ncbi:zinc ABC transporter solute-binding protein [Sediminibacillus dalangtanensis]|uniref:Zinc ABC transporter solute-binding protein n=2 Tax=Sediminibacillus dalangtanensis TaxID=2729421 RepID=A0ABX7VY64_9BACI|nr:zinc ABC transporter solute-binding protein [Sediminibacillus dalangtanensis]
MKWKVLLLLLFSGILLQAGCSPSSGQNEQKTEPTIYTTVYPIQYIMERLAGDFVEVTTIYPPGADAHSYEPTAKTMTDIAKGDAFVYLGEELETFSSTTAEALQQEKVRLIGLAGHEELFHDESTADRDDHPAETNHDEHKHGNHDPHVWLDPQRMQEMALIIEKQLTDIYPDRKAVLQQNLSSLQENLRKLDRQFVKTLRSSKHKEILVSHAAYGYWEERYGIKQIAVNGISNSSEPSQQDLINIIEQARTLKMDYVIFEQNVQDKVSKEVQKEIDGKALQIHNLAVLSEQDISRGEDYLSLMKQNLDVLKTATD